MTVLEERHIQDLIDAWFDGVLSEEEKADLERALLALPHARARFWETAQIHALLRAEGEGCSSVRTVRTGRRAAAVLPAAGGRPTETETHACAPPAHTSRTWWKAAAAVAVLLGGAGIWCAVPRSPCPVPRITSPASPVTVVMGARGLEMPSALPGTVRLAAETAKIRLPSGVELNLLGPLDMEVCDAMKIRLVSGRLLADVPPHAVGFTVLTDELELWDLGTVFGVTVSNGVSDVFVFQGSVQVNEITGEAVDLCEAGQGVRAVAGRRPCKFAADFPEAAAHYRAVAGRQKALRDPAAALAAAGRVAALWGERWLPQVMPPPPPPVPGLRGRGNREEVIGNKDVAAGRNVTGGQPSPSVGSRASGVQKLSQNPAAAGPPQQEGSAMRGMTNTVAALAAAVTMGAGAARAVPQVGNVRMQQREGTRVVDVWYDLADEAAIITLGIETNGVAIPDSAVTRLSGDVSAVVQPGTDRHIVWNAGADWPENVTESAKARVTAWSVDAPPQVMVIDLTGGPSAETYPVSYYPSVEALPYGGLTNSIYKHTQLVMRKISSDAFTMGEGTGAKQVTLTQDFYAGVFEVTQGQWYNVMGGTLAAYFTDASSRAFRPMEQVSYNDIRGSSAGAGWPDSDAVDAGSFMGVLRSKTGLSGFDLPTEAQWEYACRAGTVTAFNDGDGDANVTGANANTNAWLDALGRYRFNGGYLDGVTEPAAGCGPANGTAIVGAYAPNVWGLYDMHGNVYEWCLDWHASVLTGGTDPKGAGSGSNRVRRGGSWNAIASSCSSAYRTNLSPGSRSNNIGFRLVRILP